jgi:hypothetical protein
MPDITERLKSGGALDVLSPRLFQSIPLGIVISRLDDVADDSTLRLVAANPAASKMLRRDLGASVGRNAKDILPGLDAKRLRVLADSARLAMTRDVGEVSYGDDRLPQSHLKLSVVALPDRSTAMYFENLTDLARSRGLFDVPYLND